MHFLEAIVVAIAVGQILRIALKPPFRRDMAALPLLSIAGGLSALVVLGLSIGLMMRRPVVLDGAALVAVAGLAAAWWRARPWYGRRRGWPPGSLGIGASLDAITDRTFYLDQAEAHGPVFKMSQFGRPVVCVVGLARGRSVLLDNPDGLAGASLPYNRFLPKGSLRYMEEEHHREEGPLFRSIMSGLDLEPGEAAIRAECRRTLATLSADSRRTDGGVRARDYFERWLLAALARIFFGLEPGDPRVSALEPAYRALVLDRMGGWRWRRGIEWAFLTATEVMRDIAREGAVSGRGIPRTTALGALLAADPAALDDATRARNLFLMFRLGVGDLTSLLDWVLAKLTECPEWQDQVRATPQTIGASRGAQPPDLATRVVLETLRMEQSEYLYRRVVRPIVIDDYSIPAGWLLRICVQESHRDPAIFTDPNGFNPDRFLGRGFGRGEYSPFGADNHGCMGVPLVHFLGKIFVEELCHGYQWRVTRDGPLDRGSRHRHHWRPSAARRVVGVPIGGVARNNQPLGAEAADSTPA